MRGEIRAGYKQTEVGIIPEDWEVVEAFDLKPFITSGSRGWAKYYSDRGALFLRITNLSRTWLYPDISDQKLVEIPEGDTEGQRTSLQDGDILISITADIGVIGYVGQEVPKPAYINQHIACLRLPAAKTDSLFQSYYLASQGPQKRFMEMTDIGAKSGINLTTVGKLKLIHPPLPEQCAIAAALADADALIAALEGMIAKKRDIKQAAMQHLLTGKTRLPGFSGEWEVKRLGEVAFVFDGTHQTPSYVPSGIPFYSVEHVTSSDFSNTKFITPTEHKFLTRTVKIERGDILMTRIGSIGDCKLVDWEVDASFYVSLALLKIRPGTSARYIEQYSKTRDFQMEIEMNSLMQAIPKKINLGPIRRLAIRLPSSLEEQTAIAEVLSDMDDDLAAFEAQAAKARAVKQGMMQDLLTGRVRLV